MRTPALVLACFFLSSPVLAQESSDAPAPAEEVREDDPRDPTVTAATATASKPEPHWALQLALGTAGNVAGVLVGGGLGSMFGSGGLNGLALGILVGASAGALFGSTLGVLLLGNFERFWSTFLGAAAGLLGSLLLLPVPGGIVAGLIFPAIGATVGYGLGRPAAPQRTAGAGSPRLAFLPYATRDTGGVALTGTF